MNTTNITEEIKEKIKNAHYYKFGNVIPEGFIMIPIETFERLKDFEVWKEWKNNPESLQKLAIEDAKNF